MRVDGARLRDDLERLAGFGRNDGGGVDRASFSTADRDARDWLASRCEEAGIGYREDAVGNVFMRLDGPDAPAVWTGSHLDAVPDGGMFDGALGVVAALECLRCLAGSDQELTRPVEAVSFVDEEGAYLSLLGSTAVARGLDEDTVRSAVGRDGEPLTEALRRWGLDPDRVGEARVGSGPVHAFVELHIEQSPHLDRSGVPIGVPTVVVGIGRGRVTFEGRADHAGTTPMDDRLDAMRGLGAFLTELPGLPEQVGHGDAVVTCGKLDVAPGAYNIVAERVSAYLDFRAERTDVIDALEEAIRGAAEAAAADHGLDLRYEAGARVHPVELDAGLRELVEDVARGLDLETMRLPSRAGHDAQNMASVTRSAMVFVPSVGGRSHSPAELTRWEDVENGANVLLGTVARLVTS